MEPLEYLTQRLQSEMYQGNMHACLRDVGRLAGGYLAARSLDMADVVQLGQVAEALAINKTEAATKWAEAVGYGRADPVQWEQYVTQSQPDRALDWDDEIGSDFVVIDPNWLPSSDVDEPDDWNPVAQISEYLTALFSDEEHVGYVTESWEKDGKRIPSRGSFSRTAGELLQELARYGDIGSVFGDVNPEVGAWIRFNPLDGQGVKDSNVTDYRYALVESDQMPIDQQRGIYEKLELPIAALVHSGNKSLHAIVRIEADGIDQYRQRVDLLYDICGRNNLSIDRQNRNPSRLSRMPGVVRNGQKQHLVATNIGRPSWAAWAEWIEAVNDNLPDPESLADKWDNLPQLADPLIDGVLRQGHKMLVAGPSKSGKSFLLIQLCAAIAEGRQWLGWQCSQGRVLYVNLELDRASCLHRFRDVYRALDWPANHLANIDIWNLRGLAVPMDKLAPKLIRRASRKAYIAVVIDPIYKVITGDENSAEKMAAFCNQFDKVCHELRAAVVYCHHHSKGAQGGKRSMDRASGSGVFARDPDAMLDMIELVMSDELRKQQEDRAVCELVAAVLDRELPGWRAQVGDDDLQSEAQMRSLATRLLGARYNAVLLPLVYPARQQVARWSAWRVQGTFREYPIAQPVNCWFAYPRHLLDGLGVLQDADSEAEEPPWKRGARSNRGNAKVRANDREKRFRAAYDALAENGQARVDEMAEYLDKTPRTVRAWAGEIDGWTIENGFLKLTGGSENAF